MNQCSEINEDLDALGVSLTEITRKINELNDVHIDANDLNTVCELNNLMVRMIILNNRVKEMEN